MRRVEQTWFETNAPDGDAIWKKLQHTLKLVIAHPKSWSIHEQSSLKRAITRSGVLRGRPVECVLLTGFRSATGLRN